MYASRQSGARPWLATVLARGRSSQQCWNPTYGLQHHHFRDKSVDVQLSISGFFQLPTLVSSHRHRYLLISFSLNLMFSSNLLWLKPEDAANGQRAYLSCCKKLSSHCAWKPSRLCIFSTEQLQPPKGFWFRAPIGSPSGAQHLVRPL